MSSEIDILKTYRGFQIRHHGIAGTDAEVVCVTTPEGNDDTFNDLGRIVESEFERKPNKIYRINVSVGPCIGDGEMVAASYFGYLSEQEKQAYLNYLISAFKRSIDMIWRRRK